jgi:seryl-tRNA synthetase
VIDPKLLRASPDVVAANLARRGFNFDVPAFASLEDRRKTAQIEADRLRAERNANAKQVGMAKGKGEDAAPLLARGELLAQQLVEAEAAINGVQAELDALQMGLPNLLQESVPQGTDESANVEDRRWGTPRTSTSRRATTWSCGERLRPRHGFRGGRQDGGQPLRRCCVAGSRGCTARCAVHARPAHRRAWLHRMSMCRISSPAQR